MQEMKDSGVEWLGEIPAGWALRQAGQLADQAKVPNEGMIETNLLSLSYGKVKRRDINAADGLLPASFETYNVIEPNDIVLRFTDLQNDQKSLRVGRATERGIITSAYVTVRPLNPSYSRGSCTMLCTPTTCARVSTAWAQASARVLSGRKPST